MVIRSAFQKCISGSAMAAFKVGSMDAFIYYDRNELINLSYQYRMQISVRS